MPAVDLFEVVGGQDRGARFGFLGTSAVIGRGRTVEVLLTDPEVAVQHALVRVEGAVLRLIDLNRGHIQLNGRRLTAPTPLRVDDLVRVGDTTLRVLWTPGRRALAPPAPPAPRPAPLPAPPPAAAAPPARGPIALRAAAPPPALGNEGLAVAAAALAALLAMGATLMPAARAGGELPNLWRVDPTGLRPAAILIVLALVTTAVVWAVVELDRDLRRLGPVAAVGCAVTGGAVAGVALALRVIPGGDGPGEGATALLVAGLVAAAAGVWRVQLAAGPRRGPRPGRPDAPTLLVAVAAAGGVLCAIAGPMDWTTVDGLTYSGFDGEAAAGRLMVPLGLLMTAACLLVPLVGARIERRTVAPMAALAATLAGVLAGYAVAAAIVSAGDIQRTGLTLALAAGTLALVPCAAGALALAADRRPAVRRSSGHSG